MSASALRDLLVRAREPRLRLRGLLVGPAGLAKPHGGPLLRANAPLEYLLLWATLLADRGEVVRGAQLNGR